MSDRTYAKVQVQQKTLSGSSPRSSLLQRTCACGQHTIAGAECSTCRSEQSMLHRSQRTFGSSSTSAVTQSNSPTQENVFPFNAAADRVSRFGHDFSNIPIHSSHPPVLQTKLKINQPGDIYEQEADQVAEQVMRTPEPQLQRACACGGACPKCQTEQPDQEHDRVQAKRVGSGDLGQTAVPPIVHEVLRSPGQRLDPATRAFMEPRFSHDFAKVRVHTNNRAAESAEAVNALAYTVGNNLVFGAGQYAPASSRGQWLLAHELTHVMQQASAATSTLQRQPTHNDVADLELELQSKMSERALLARLLEDSQKNLAADVYDRRINSGAQKEQAKLKAGTQAHLGRIMDAETVQLLKNKIDVVRGEGGFTLKVRFELSYLGLTDKKGRTQAATDIPRIENAIRDAWTIDLKEGRYSGNKFRLEPQIEFRPNARERSDKALQLIVRREDKDESLVLGLPGRSVEISFNPKHLQGDQVVIAAHELYHLFGWIDAYYDPENAKKKNLKGDPNAPWKKHVVGRRDAAGRGDLLGMPDLKHLREWRDKGFISQADFDRQTRTQLKVWQEDADRILYALGVPPNADKTGAQNDPNSPGFDPQVALRATEAKARQRLADLQSATDRYAEDEDFVQKAERAIKLDEEIAALQKKIAERKSGGAKGPAKP